MELHITEPGSHYDWSSRIPSLFVAVISPDDDLHCEIAMPWDLGFDHAISARYLISRLWDVDIKDGSIAVPEDLRDRFQGGGRIKYPDGFTSLSKIHFDSDSTLSRKNFARNGPTTPQIRAFLVTEIPRWILENVH